MALASEDVDSRKINLGRSPGATFKYTIVAAADELDARTAMLAIAPLAYQGLFRMTGEIDPVGNGVYRGTVTYGLGERQGVSPQDGSQGGNETKPTDALGPELDFDIGSTTRKITKAIRTADSIKKTADARPIPDTKDAIGLSGKGLEGCDVEDTHLEWSETWAFPPGTVTWGYLTVLLNAGRTVNTSRFRTFGPLQVRFRGASIRASGTEKTKITYKFAAAKDPLPELEDAFKPSDGWARFDAGKGPNPWDYVDVLYERDVNSTTKLMIPRCVYLRVVYYRSDFALLGIGQ